MSHSMILLDRSGLGNCRGCGKSPEKEEFRGSYNEYGTHAKSKNGWWLRIAHHFDYTMKGRVREPDSVGDLLCPDCLEKHNDRMANMLDLFGDHEQ